MQIQFNGQPREVETATPALELLGEFRVRAKGVAVAINGEVVPANQLANRILCDGDRVEVIEAVGGG